MSDVCATNLLDSGFLVLDKSAGISSNKALNAVKHRMREQTGRKVKVGHAGTLDPFATGVLVVLVGKATKQCENVMGLAKTYEATVKLGATTATLDPESNVESGPVIEPPSRAQIEAVLAGMVGEVQQVPPAFSALKVNGKRAYKLARDGETPKLSARTVRIDRLDLLDHDGLTLRLRVQSGRGFYVRSLARDVAAALGTTGYLTQLRRTAVGPFTQDLAGDATQSLLPVTFLES
ncbi:MAG: tRNA pseudouridine(55) synthase TruB [Planctomycetota bacterium]